MFEPVGMLWWILVVLLADGTAGEPTAGAPPNPSASLRICAWDSNPPFFFRDEEGTYRGLEHDLLAAFATEQELEMKVRQSTRSIETFREKCDVGASTVTRTKDREQRYDFSSGYFPVRVVAVQRKSSLTTKLEELEGLVGATLVPSTYDQAVRSIPGVQPLVVEDIESMFEAVRSGKADFLAYDSATVLPLLEKYPDLRITVPLSERGELGFLLMKGSSLTEPLSRFVDSAWEDGRMAEILGRYFDGETVQLILDSRSD